MSYTATIVDTKGVTKKTQEVFAQLTGYEPKYKVLPQVIRAEQLSLRTGGAHTKSRAEVRGGGKKPWRQKGTGRARHGSIRSPIWVGGGVAWGPRSARSWHRDINKSSRITALKTLLYDRATHSGLFVLSSLDYKKTKDAALVIESIGKLHTVPANRIALIYHSDDRGAINGFGNLGVIMQNSANLRFTKLSHASHYVFTSKSLQHLEERLTSKKTSNEAAKKATVKVANKKTKAKV